MTSRAKSKPKLVQQKSDEISKTIFITALKSMVKTFTKTQPEETQIAFLNSINAHYISLKDKLLSQFANDISAKEREKTWNNVTAIFSEILQPLIALAYSPPIQVVSSHRTTMPE